MTGLPSVEVFHELWESGYRLLSKEDMDSFDYGMKREISPGRYEVLTIRGMMEIAKKHGKIKMHGTDLTEEEVEKFWNIIVFQARNKGK